MEYPDFALLKYPVIHRRKVPFRPAVISTPSLTEKLRQIQRLDGELERFFLSLQDYGELVAESVASNIHFSTMREGNPLSLSQVQRATRRTLHDKVVSEKKPSIPYQEIYNHLAVWIDPGAYQPPISLDQVLQLHALLMAEIDPEALPGTLRERETTITSDHGQETFRPCPPNHIREELESLWGWTNQNLGILNPVVLATTFFHEFESIHPFVDGNGRVGRTLFHILLQAGGLPNSHLCFVEQELIREGDRYYEVLAWTDQTGEYGPLLDFFADAILRSYHDAAQRLASKDLPGSRLSEEGRRIAMAGRRHGDWFDLRTATSWVHGIGEQSVRKQLASLVREGLVRAKGSTRARRYRYIHPYEQLRLGLRPFFTTSPFFRKAFEDIETRNPERRRYAPRGVKKRVASARSNSRRSG